jgi:FkbM family methyltransferase
MGESGVMADLLGRYERAVRFARSPWLRRAIRRPLGTIMYAVAPIWHACVPLSIHVHARTFFDETMHVVFPEGTSCQLLYYGGIEEDVTYFLLRYLKDGMVFFDVGAHYGYFTLLGSTLVGTSGCVQAFEPSQRTCDLLRANTAHKPNIRINQQGLWSHRTAMPFFDYGPRFSPISGFFKHSAIRAKNVRTVECTTLDEYCRETGLQPDFIKLDAESSEGHILQGGECVIRDQRPIISMEVGDFAEERHALGSRDKIQFLLDRGYVAYTYGPGGLTRHILRSRYGLQNLLLLPASAAC